MTTTQQRLAEYIMAFYFENDCNYNSSLNFISIMESIDQNTRLPIDEIYRQTVLDPISQFVSFFPAINELISKRSKKLLDYDQIRTKSRKLVENPSEDPTKLTRIEGECSVKRGIYEDIHNRLLHDMPQLISLRDAYLQPSFECFHKIQVKFFNEFLDNLESVQFDTKAMGSQSQNILDQMKQLSICV